MDLNEQSGSKSRLSLRARDFIRGCFVITILLLPSSGVMVIGTNIVPLEGVFKLMCNEDCLERWGFIPKVCPYIHDDLHSLCPR